MTKKEIKKRIYCAFMLGIATNEIAEQSNSKEEAEELAKYTAILIKYITEASIESINEIIKGKNPKEVLINTYEHGIADAEMTNIIEKQGE